MNAFLLLSWLSIFQHEFTTLAQVYTWFNNVILDDIERIKRINLNLG